MNLLEKLWFEIKSSFWFIPGLILIGHILLAIVLFEVDDHINRTLIIHDWPNLLFTNEDGARIILSSIATSMITIAALVFSITLLALAQASTQFSPRVLRHFTGDRFTQVVMGFAVGIFIYCLIVLRFVHPDMPPIPAFVPPFSIAMAFILALVGISFLILFIHHIVHLLQAASIIQEIHDDTLRTIHSYYQSSLPDSTTEIQQLEKKYHWYAVPTNKTGFIETIAFKYLLRLAKKNDLIIRLEHRIGAFIIADFRLVSVTTQTPPSAQLIKKINNCFSITGHRSTRQDVSFGIQQLVDIALKTVTPGVNDITTTISCINHLTSIMVTLTRCHSNEYELLYYKNKPRLILQKSSFTRLLHHAFHQITQNAIGNPLIQIRILRALKIISQMTSDPQHKQALLVQIEKLKEIIELENESQHKIQTKLKIQEFVNNI